MQEYDLYIDKKKPALGLYVRKGAGLPDLEDTEDWSLVGTVTETDLPPSIVRRLRTTGHSFRDLKPSQFVAIDAGGSSPKRGQRQ